MKTPRRIGDGRQTWQVQKSLMPATSKGRMSNPAGETSDG